MHIQPKMRTKLVDAAMGRIPLDLYIKNTKLVNVFTGEIYKADIGIYDGFIVHIKADPDGLNREEIQLKAKEVYDAKGKYAIPGLLDMHIHIESTMMTPRNFAKSVLPHGTTTVVTDPHEIANVLGVEGVKYMVESSKNLPMRQLIAIPSCVPAVPGKENAGAEFFSEEIDQMLQWERVIGLAEIMDFPGVINNSHRMVDIIDSAIERDMFLQGHIIGVSSNQLSAYKAAGPVSDHETRDPQEARDKLRIGMYVDARESSISRNVSDIVKNTRDFRFLPNLTLCTDDREPEDILTKGHMNDVVRQAILAGMDPVEAIRCATYNAAREINISNVGALAPGYVADILLLDSLQEMVPSAVFFQGELVAKDGKLITQIEDKSFDIEKVNSVHVDKIDEDTYKVKAPIQKGKVKVNVICYESPEFSPTVLKTEEINVKDGYLDISHDENLKYVCVINRHKGHSTKSYGIVRNFGSKKGAVGSTISHDCHNLTLVYDNEVNAEIVANDIVKSRGGISCAVDGKFANRLVLPLAGLMSLKPCEELAIESELMKKTLNSIGLKQKNPLLRIATLALPVIPKVKMSDLGIVDVLKQEIIKMYPEF